MASKSKTNVKGGLIEDIAGALDGSGISLESVLDAAMNSGTSKKKSGSSTRKKSSKSDSLVSKLLGDDTYYPQFSEKTYWAIREKFQKSIPEKVTASTLTNATGLKADTVKSTVLPALESMGLLKDGKPTAKLKAWVNDSKYEDSCGEIREKLYPSALRKLEFNTKTQQNAVVSWFKKNAGASETAAKKMLAVYLLLSAPKLKNAVEEKAAASKKTSSAAAKSGTAKKSAASSQKTTPEAAIDSLKVTTKAGKSTITVKIGADEGITKKALTEKFAAAAADAFSQMK